jgi:hypothetical protein
MAQLNGIITCKGWKIVAASSNADALSLLKSRNWEAVVLDGQLFGASCVCRGSGLEQQNRIAANDLSDDYQFDSLLQTPNSVCYGYLAIGFSMALLSSPCHRVSMALLLNQ